MTVSLVLTVRYGNCCHFCPYLRLRYVWSFAMHACTYVHTHNTQIHLYILYVYVCTFKLLFAIFHLRQWYVSLASRDSYLEKFRKKGANKQRGNPIQGSASFFLPSRYSGTFFGRCENTEKLDSANYLSAIMQRLQNLGRILRNAFLKTSFPQMLLYYFLLCFTFPQAETCKSEKIKITRELFILFINYETFVNLWSMPLILYVQRCAFF